MIYQPGLRFGLVCLLLVSSQENCLVAAKNMNGGAYTVANAMDTDQGNTKKQYSTEYKAEYFDVYSPAIRTTYGEVFWTMMDPVSLPADIIARFSSSNDTATTKVMAIVGYEVDQVRRVPREVVVVEEDKDGSVSRTTTVLEDVPVPITHAYNHHFIAFLNNRNKGRMVKTAVPKELNHHLMTHGSDEMWEFVRFEEEEETVNDNKPGINHAQVFSEANGGEMRGSYHGYPKGYAQLIQSPDTWMIQPMQIDTFNRDSVGPKFEPGPLPIAAPLRRHDTNATTFGDSYSYSGLLECPCTDDIEKKWWYNYKLLSAASDVDIVLGDAHSHCADERQIANATECFAAGRFLIPSSHTETHETSNDESLPHGCSVDQRATTGALDITWNAGPCVDSGMPMSAPRKQQQQQLVAFATGVINATVTLTSLAVSSTEDATAIATINLVGPKGVWFGIGFDTSDMCRRKMQADECPSDGPYAILVYDDHIEERALDFHGKGQVLPNSNLKVVSNLVVGDHRLVVLERPMQGADGRYYTFDMDQTSLPVIIATGCNMTLAQHCGHGASNLNFLSTETPRTVCRDGIQASIAGKRFDEGNRCAPFPTSTLLEQHNPTCSIHTYRGGLNCCIHGKTLLDSDQETPWKDQVLEYHIKFRFYFEEYTPAKTTTEVVPPIVTTATKQIATQMKTITTTTPASHQNLLRFYWTTEAFAGEYDIVQCPPGTPTSQCIQVISSRWPVRDLLSNCQGPWCSGPGSDKADGIELIYAAPHCHAPSCLSIELYNADTGKLLCHVQPTPGQSTDTIYDELGFIAIPPCLWGHQDGLMKPIFLSSNTTLLSIKRNNNTIGHLGEMASWQMRGVVVMDKNKKETAATLNAKIHSSEVTADTTTDGSEMMTEPRTSVRRGRPEV